MMEQQLRAGTNPNDGNVFAQVLDSKKARPLLGFFRQFRAEFPALEDQAALALAEAVKHRQVRWVALLAWAGADPFRPVPNSLDETFPVDPDDCTTAAREAA
jgi:23S rRNA C2498 (ribose-2'-O)-methylase RlmM